MAKKKSARTSEKPAEQDLLQQPVNEPPRVQQQTHLPSPVMEEQDGKLSKLKSLNELLLKETTEKRKEVSDLLESKKSLETELGRSSSEVEALRSELSRVKSEQAGYVSMVAGEADRLRKEVESLEFRNEEMRERNVVLVRERDEIQSELRELEKEMQGALKEKNETEKARSEEIRFLKKSLDQMNGEIEKLRDELSSAGRDKEAIQKKYELQVEETFRLGEKLSVVVAEENKRGQDLKLLRSKYDEAMKVNRERELAIESLKSDTKSIESCLAESKRRIQELEKGIELIKQGKVLVEKERDDLKSEVGKLAKEADQLNHIISSLKKDEEVQREKFKQLEYAYAEAVEKQNELNREVSVLSEESMKKDNIMEKLTGEISEASERSHGLEKELGIARGLEQKLRLEKDEIQQVKAGLDSDIVRLQKEVAKLSDQLSALEESNHNQAEVNKKLSSELQHHSSNFDRVTQEKNAVQKALDVEKLRVTKLNVKLTDLSKKIDDASKQLETLKAANEDLVGEKRELEGAFKGLMGEKGLVEKRFLASQKHLAVLEENLKAKSNTLDQALILLKKTAEQLSEESKEGEKPRSLPNEPKVNGDVEAYVGQIEVIRAAFFTREMKVEEMQQQLESLQVSVVEARKRKSIWTAATTIVAAVVSFAVASKLR